MLPLGSVLHRQYGFIPDARANYGVVLGFTERNRRILSLFQLDFAEPSVVRPDVAGRPVYLACAMNADNVLRIKPQNLLLNLPLASIS